MSDRLAEQLRFIVEIDKVKSILRQTLLMDGSRAENDAEHSWHLAVMALVLHEHAAEPVNLGRVLSMVLIHDIVEIDAGDTFAYDTAGRRDQHAREAAAAERIFGLLPADQAAEFRAIWDEFEARQTPEARFANALDRFQPLYHNVMNQGHAWRKHGVPKAAVIERNRHIDDGCRLLWAEARRLLDEASASGWLHDGETAG